MLIIFNIANKSKHLLLICFGLFVISCKKDQSIKIYDIKPSYEMTEFNDSVFFDLAQSILYKDSKFLIPARDKILVLDKNFNLKQTISKLGKGPGEFLETLSLDLYNDTIYGYDNGSHSLKGYDLQGNFVNTSFHVPGVEMPMFMQRFCLDANNAYLAGNEFLVQYDLLSGVSNNLYQFNSPEKSARSVFLYKKSELIIVNHESPVIIIMNINNNKVYEINLGEHEVIKPTLNIAGNTQNGGVFTLINDAYISEDWLYFLLSRLDLDGGYTSNQVVRVNLETGELDNRILKLDGRVFTSFCVYDTHNLIAFSHTNMSFQVYENICSDK